MCACVYVKVIVMVQIALSTNKKLTQLDVFKQKKKKLKKVIKSREVEEKNHYKCKPVPPSCGCSIWESPWKGSRSRWAWGWLWGNLWAASPRAGPGHPEHPRVQPDPTEPSTQVGSGEQSLLPWDRGLWRAGCSPGKAGTTHLPTLLLLLVTSIDPVPGSQRSFVLDLAAESPESCEDFWCFPQPCWAGLVATDTQLVGALQPCWVVTV